MVGRLEGWLVGWSPFSLNVDTSPLERPRPWDFRPRATQDTQKVKVDGCPWLVGWLVNTQPQS